jgi:hypothetical protein
MTNIIRFYLFLLVLYLILFYFSISRMNLFGDFTTFINLLTILILLGLGIYYPRFSKGINEGKVSKIKLIWNASFLLLFVGFQMVTGMIHSSIFYIIVMIMMVLMVMNVWRVHGRTSN